MGIVKARIALYWFGSIYASVCMGRAMALSDLYHIVFYSVGIFLCSFCAVDTLLDYGHVDGLGNRNDLNS